ncbi:MAG TPA: hypothetical protein PLS53_01055, partial [Thermoanaerobaculaceae bacterium]|nr:hypothetical protein [Thermoanaerobaculaceae bacterium]
IQLGRLNAMLSTRGLRIETTPEAEEMLARDGFDPDFGARPLRRTIQRLVQDPLARLVLEGQVADGTTVRLKVADGELRLVPLPATPPDR